MRINDTLNIIQRKESKNYDVFHKDDKFIICPDNDLYGKVKELYISALKKEEISDDRLTALMGIIRSHFSGDADSTPPTPTINPKNTLLNGLNGLMKFFTEFQFEPNFRFVNSFSLALAKSDKQGKEYISNYFELIDSPYIKEIREKIKSPEFKQIIKDIKAVKPTSVINKRFKLYYGSQGTGKTTIAMRETDNRCMVCNSSMLPADLMEDFVFVDGKATFKPSALWRCMVEGKPIVLDELNLLPFDSLRFLQTILDGKTEFLYKGNRIEIADGFCVIGTMNLCVNGMVYGLPEPLVDRCAETKKFSLSASDLIKAICE